MATGTCRKCGLWPRRLRRGIFEPLRENCHRAAMANVARELAHEVAPDRRKRLRTINVVPGGCPPD